jgi:hypothetical protein
MSDDAIKAALEAGAKAFCLADGECPCTEAADCSLWGPCLPDTAAAIAAFLRARADEMEKWGLRAPPGLLRDEAAAVERAAKGEA